MISNHPEAVNRREGASILATSILTTSLLTTSLLVTGAALLLLSACGGGSALRASMAPMPMAELVEMDHNPFSRDTTGAISEDDLIRAVASPVYLASETRLGIVPVAVAYEADEEIPLVEAPSVLATALEDTGFFSVTSEVSTDWPSDRSISGLRELAARYRTRYLLLYRHRFVERQHTNGWAATYITLIAIPFVPSETIETAGVLEATLFDVATGTIMFTEYQRVYAESDETIWSNERRLREMREELLDEAAELLADKVVHQIHRLVAARPTSSSRMLGVRLDEEP